MGTRTGCDESIGTGVNSAGPPSAPMDTAKPVINGDTFGRVATTLTSDAVPSVEFKTIK